MAFVVSATHFWLKTTNNNDSGPAEPVPLPRPQRASKTEPMQLDSEGQESDASDVITHSLAWELGEQSMTN